MDGSNPWGSVDPNLLISTIGSPTAGIDAYQAAQAAGAQRQLAAAQNQRAIQQQAIGDAALKDALSNPNPDTYRALLIARPDLVAGAKAAHDSLDEDTQRSQLRDMSAINGYLTAKQPQPDQAAKILQNYIAGAKKQGKDTTPFESLLNTIQTNPAAAAVLSGTFLAATSGADKAANTQATMGKEARDQAAEPGKEALTAAQAAQARAQAAKDGYIVAGPDQTVLAVGSGGAGTPATAPAPTGPPVSGSDTSRGARNNNPLNLTNLPTGKWSGQTGSDGKFAVFNNPAAGMAAADKNLQSYARDHGINTVAGIVNRWAPQGDGNDPAAYAANVAASVGVDPNAPLDLSDAKVRKAVLGAMAKVETPGAGASGGAPAPGPEAPANGLSVAFRDADAQAPLSPEGIAMVGTQYMRLGPDALKNLGQGGVGVKNKDRVLNWAAQQARDAGTSNPELVLRFVQNKANMGALNQVQKNLSLITASEATLNANADLALKYAKAGGNGPTGQPWLDTPINAIRRQTGSVAAKDLDNVMKTTAREYAKILTTTTGAGGGATSDSAAKEANDLLNSNMTLGQMIGAINVARQEAHNRHSANAAEVARLGQEISGVGPAPGVAPAPAPAPAPTSGGGWGKATVVGR